jgi:hypothetical protein
MLHKSGLGLGLALSVAALGTFAPRDSAQARDGFILVCPPNNGDCRITAIPAPVGRLRWYSNVYVQGDGDLGRFRVRSRSQCQELCDQNDQCVLVEYYYGEETRSNMCNLFSFPVPMRRNTSGDAQVGIYE